MRGYRHHRQARGPGTITCYQREEPNKMAARDTEERRA
jgi:hypothetical protein